MEKVVNVIGLVVFPLLAWGLSVHRRRFPWRVALWAVGLQILIALFILKTSFGAGIFEWAQRAVNQLISFSDEGAKMVFGPLADKELLQKHWGAANATIFCITVTATIILVSSLSSLLYYWRILPKIVAATAWVMRKTMGTSGSESLATAANIFMGMTEAPLLIRPYLARMTQSEMMALMTGGMATIAGGVLAAYVSFGISAGHLLTASVMSAPAALMMAKIMFPETEESETAGRAAEQVRSPAINSIDALCRGATDGLMLSLNVMAMLLAFVALVALANFLCTEVQQWAFALIGISAKPASLQTLVGWVNAPFAWLMGIPKQDLVVAGSILGERIVLNEFISYTHLAQVQQTLHPRTTVLITYALCGFANFGSIAVQIGGIGALVPERRSDLARLGMRSMIAGLLACYFTATLVGLLS